jgi:predicted SAM-dependent methyltransferase
LRDGASGGSAKSLIAGLYVQYGCGLCAPDGWLNFDASPRLRLERVAGLRMLLRGSVGLLFPANARPGDIVRGLPVADGTVRGVYCSHVLEHLPRNDVAAALRNTHRMLAAGGLFRLVVPDLRWRAAQYLNSAERHDPQAADALMDACLLGTRQRSKTLMASLRSRFGRSAHAWMYDFAALKGLLEQAGFDGVRRCEFGDCHDPMFARVEEEDRFIDSGERELAIEAVKPSAGAPARALAADRLQTDDCRR